MSHAPGKSYFQQRQRNRLYEVVIRAVQAAGQKGMKRRDIAASLGKSPSNLSHWLSGPANWTIDGVSDVLFAIHAEMDFFVLDFSSKVRDNRHHELNTDKPQNSFEITKTEAALPAISIRVAD